MRFGLFGLFSVTGVTVAYNAVTFSEQTGIQSEGRSTSGNTFLHNVVTNSGQFGGQPDCLDGPADTWIDNVGSVTDIPSSDDICPPRVA